ncbi:MAG: 16S rRNA (adenine(1518)-N(6)/adenine(1519)-N(6))-dimethyltransferase RsmA [Clostridia bacterium]|nr:16S rRNA (adenine(1518)-N(6)/adenine(1519)-N(6))-dimethyltransferase RsmA [Clostridia bacterium]
MKVAENFKFNKNFGQNFISDKNLLGAIVKDSGISFESEVLEIGTGAGTLTQAIGETAKKVVSYEIDKKLTEVLAEKFENNNKVKIIIGDALKLAIEDIESNFSGDYFIIANLPYYITTPLIFKFLEQTNRAKVITIMVQKEVAEKIVATPNTKNFGILSVMLSHYCDTKITRIVKRQMFFPRPNVDSAIIKLTRKPNVFFDKNFLNFVSGCFAMKRKTLLNNLLKLGYKKETIENAFACQNLSLQIRAESLSVDNFRQLFANLEQNKKNN